MFVQVVVVTGNVSDIPLQIGNGVGAILAENGYRILDQTN